MAAQVYSRYIPPATKSSPKAISSAQPATDAVQPRLYQPTTRHDASSTYTRYVPPSKPQASTRLQVFDIDSPSLPQTSVKRKQEEVYGSKEQPGKTVKKHKNAHKGKHFDTGIDPRAQLEEHVEAMEVGKAALEAKQPNSKKRRNADHATNDTDVRGTEDANNTRHTKLMRKRERSLRKAQKVTREEDGEVPTPIDPVELHDLVPLPQPEPAPEAPIQFSTTSLPSWLANPVRFSLTTKTPFSEIGVKPEIAAALQAKGFEDSFAVQAAVLPLLLEGDTQTSGDVLISAATGSGKTLAYVLPMVEDLSKNQTIKLRGLIIVPTRELVAQARNVIDMCVSALGGGAKRRVRIGTAVGNENFKVEQALLMDQELQYDPGQYQNRQRRLNSKWESSDRDSDVEDEIFCDDQVVSCLPDHVMKPVSKIDILICTPGRLVDHLKKTPGFGLNDLKWLVIDEADKLLDQSFQQWLNLVIPLAHGRSPGREQVRKVVLSATMTTDIGQLNSLRLYRPQLVLLEGSSNDGPAAQASNALFLPSQLIETGIKVDDQSIKPLYLMEVLKRENLIPLHNPKSPGNGDSSSSSSDESFEDGSPDPDSPASTEGSRNGSPRSVIHDTGKRNSLTTIPHGVLIFTKSNETAVRLGRLMALLDGRCADIIGTLTSTARSSVRKATLKSFESGDLCVLVASDLVARGLDLSNLAHVINYDVPTSLTSYVHRVGRTARAGKNGHAWTLFTASEGRWFWNEIGRSLLVERAAKSQVQRVKIGISVFDDLQRQKYEKALEALGHEANRPKPEKFNPK